MLGVTRVLCFEMANGPVSLTRRSKGGGNADGIVLAARRLVDGEMKGRLGMVKRKGA